ncbi:DUF6651 domain-containing protein [Desulfovibrio fairfieldensis]|uniref:DUF6651 domain-containing protein n=1 Tax=Desulfovibrio fairfieldensis TaxID=44742 RepID=A0A0X8JIL1_9BACT|nr:DUF6651 domain-containing protein [Desulfovibrio fairfieldensis]AMD89483.1 hypothetical protein AXF13_04790 [Desulfovibrio fairfieldensis]
MPFKKDEHGNYVEQDGLLVFVGPDGAERPYDPDAKAKQIAELTEKSAKRGKELEDFKARYAALADIEDPGAFVSRAKQDAETVASLKDKDRTTEEAFQKRLAAAVKDAVSPVAAERDKLKGEQEQTLAQLHQAVIGGSFAQSKYVADKLVNPALAQRLFQGSFYIKDGKPVGRDGEGNDIYGTDGIANFDEALCKLVEASPFKDNILRPTPGGAGTNNTNTATNFGGSGRMTPEQAGGLTPEAYAKARKDGRI